MGRRMLCGLGILFLLALAALAACASESALKSILPKSGAVSSWDVYADTYQYCANPDELYKLYDGGDQPWIKAGVLEAVQQAYKKGDGILTLTVHRMKSWQAAKALFQKKDGGIKQQPGYEKVTLKQAHSLCRANGVTIGYGWKKTYFLGYTLNTADASGAATTKAFMKAVAGKIK